MRITTITIKLGETVNLGNYSNFRPEISATAEIGLGESVDREMARLTRVVEEQLADLVDDALEQAEMEPKYATSLFGVRINKLRGVVVVFDKRLKLPEQATWRDKDRWERVDGAAHFMRQHPAIDAAADISQQQGLSFRFIGNQEHLDRLPGLPDPGPEPLWSQKGLREWLERIRTPETEWDMLAALPHVTPGYIQQVYHKSPYSVYELLKDAIVSGPTLSVDDNDGWDEEE